MYTTPDFLKASWILQEQAKNSQSEHYQVGPPGILELPPFNGQTSHADNVRFSKNLTELSEILTDWNRLDKSAMDARMRSLLSTIGNTSEENNDCQSPILAINVAIEYFLNSNNDREKLMKDAKDYIANGIRELL